MSYACVRSSFGLCVIVGVSGCHFHGWFLLVYWCGAAVDDCPFLTGGVAIKSIGDYFKRFLFLF